MPFLSYVLCHIMTLKRMLAESAVEKIKIMSAFVTRAVRFVIFKTAVFAMAVSYTHLTLPTIA